MKKYSIIILLSAFSYLICPAQQIRTVFPKNNQVLKAVNNTLLWNNIDTVDKYHVQVSYDSLFSNLLINNDSCILNFLVLDSLPKNKFWWRVRGVWNQIPFPWSIASTFKVYTPLISDSLKLWLTTEKGMIFDSVSRISVWQDQSGNNHHAIQSLPNSSPIINSITAKKPFLRFDGIDDFMQSSNIQFDNYTVVFIRRMFFSTSHKTIISKLDPIGWTTGFALTGLNHRQHSRQGNGTTISDYYGAFDQDSVTYIDACKYDGNNRQLYRWGMNSAAPLAYNVFVPNNSAIQIGRILPFGTGWYYKGFLGDIMIFGKALSNEEIKLVNDYIHHSYAPPINLGYDCRITYGFCKDSLDAGPYFTKYLWSTGDTIQKIAVRNAGTYWCEATDIFGFKSRDTVLVYNTVPALNIKDSVICQGTSFIATPPLHFSQAPYQFLWSTNDTISSISIFQPGQYWLKISDTLGCFVTDTFTVALDSFPSAADLGPDLNFCAGNSVGLVQGQQQVKSYQWSTSDTTSSILITNPGIYKVTVTNQRGCVATDSINVFIKGIAPYAKFNVDSVCLGLPSIFQDSSYSLDSSTINLWQWDFGDGSPPTTSSVSGNTSHVFQTPGTYNVKLTVTTDSSCVSSVIKPAFVHALPIADFTPITACSRTPLQFTDKTTISFGQLSSWLWGFGDTASGSLNNSTVQHPQHIFNSEGDYMVNLSVTSSAGCNHSINKPISIRPTPYANFSSSNTCFGETTWFNDISISAPWHPISERKWFFSATDSLSGPNPSWVFPTAGTKVVRLWVKNTTACFSDTVKSVIVHPKPIAGIKTAHNCAGLPGSVFDNSTISSGSIQQWYWNFGVYGISFAQNPLISIPDTGVFPVKLQITTAAGCKDSTMGNIFIHGLPYADFSFDPEYGEAPLSVIFTNKSSAASSYLWNFGDGGISTQKDPVYLFNQSGVYNVLLTSFNTYLCPDTAQYPVFVIYTPIDVTVGLALAQVSADNYLSVSAQIRNSGFQKIKKLEITARFHGDKSIRESWEGLLLPGASMIYTFNSRMQILDNNIPEILCVEAFVPGVQPDEFPQDNIYCASLKNLFFVLNPYPNPSGDELQLSFISPLETNMEIAIYSTKGENLGKYYSGNVFKGVNNIKLLIEKLNSGVYTLHITSNEQVVVKKFVKL